MTARLAGMIRNIIFDWSGTLVDDLPAVWEATNYVLVQAGRAQMTLKEFREGFRLPFTAFYDRCMPGVEYGKLDGWFHERFPEVQGSVKALPHAKEFLEFCRTRGIRTFLLSAVRADYFATQVGVTGFGEYLDRPYIDVRDKRKKIHEILSENQIAAGETMFIGDMEHDVETARHGGVRSCGVLTGYNTLDQLRAAGPDLIVEDLRELRQILEKDDLQLTAPRCLDDHVRS